MFKNKRYIVAVLLLSFMVSLGLPTWIPGIDKLVNTVHATVIAKTQLKVSLETQEILDNGDTGEWFSQDGGTLTVERPIVKGVGQLNEFNVAPECRDNNGNYVPVTLTVYKGTTKLFDKTQTFPLYTRLIDGSSDEGVYDIRCTALGGRIDVEAKVKVVRSTFNSTTGYLYKRTAILSPKEIPTNTSLSVSKVKLDSNLNIPPKILDPYWPDSLKDGKPHNVKGETEIKVYRLDGKSAPYAGYYNVNDDYNYLVNTVFKGYSGIEEDLSTKRHTLASYLAPMNCVAMREYVDLNGVLLDTHTNVNTSIDSSTVLTYEYRPNATKDIGVRSRGYKFIGCRITNPLTNSVIKETTTNAIPYDWDYLVASRPIRVQFVYEKLPDASPTPDVTPIPTPSPTPELPSPDPVEGGTIIFAPNKTSGWTNSGKISDGQGSFKVRVTNTKPTVKTLAYAYGDNGEVVSSEVTYTAPGITVVIYDLMNETSSNVYVSGSEGDIFLKDQGRYMLFGISYYSGGVAAPTRNGLTIFPPPPPATGYSYNYSLDWKSPNIWLSSFDSNGWLNYPYPINIGISENLSGFKNSSYTVTDSSYYNRSKHYSIEDTSSNGYSSSITLNSGIYSIAFNVCDSAGNNKMATYGQYKVDTVDPDEAEFLWDDQVRKVDDQYEYFSDQSNSLRVRIGDDLSGIGEVKYLWSQSPDFPAVSGMTNYDVTTVEGNKDTKDITVMLNSSTKYEDLKKGLWYLHIYQKDRAGNERKTTSPKIFICKLEDFRCTFIEDIRWYKMFYEKQWDYLKGDFEVIDKSNNFAFRAKDMVINSQNNPEYGTNIKKGYPVHFKLDSYGFNTEESKLDIYISYWYWDMHDFRWEKVCTRYPYTSDYMYFYSQDNLHYYPLGEYPANNEEVRSFEHIWTTDDTSRFYNKRSMVNGGADQKAIWETRYWFPFGEAVAPGGAYSSSDGQGFMLKRDSNGDFTGVFDRPILVNFRIVARKGGRTYDYTAKEDAWGWNPNYPDTKGNIMVVGPRSLESDISVNLN